MCKLSEGVVPTPPLISEPSPIKWLISNLSSDTNQWYQLVPIRMAQIPRYHVNMFAVRAYLIPNYKGLVGWYPPLAENSRNHDKRAPKSTYGCRPCKGSLQFSPDVLPSKIGIGPILQCTAKARAGNGRHKGTGGENRETNDKSRKGKQFC